MNDDRNNQQGGFPRLVPGVQERMLDQFAAADSEYAARARKALGAV